MAQVSWLPARYAFVPLLHINKWLAWLGAWSDKRRYLATARVMIGMEAKEE